MKYKSKSQVARVETERWALDNLYCPFCGNKVSESPANTKVYDFRCAICNQEYQLKALSKKIGKKLVGSEYYSFIKALQSASVPNFFIMEYGIKNDAFFVKEIVFVPKVFITEEAIEKRKPLSETARRAGWTGYNLLFEQIPSYGKIKIFNNQGLLLKESIIAEAKKVRNLYNNSPEKAKWKIEVLKIIDRLEGEFSLQDIYNYTTSLELLFPENKHIKEKIRQQLQFIRDDGIIIFIGNGKYKKI